MRLKASVIKVHDLNMAVQSRLAVDQLRLVDLGALRARRADDVAASLGFQVFHDDFLYHGSARPTFRTASGEMVVLSRRGLLQAAALIPGVEFLWHIDVGCRPGSLVKASDGTIADACDLLVITPEPGDHPSEFDENFIESIDTVDMLIRAMQKGVSPAALAQAAIDRSWGLGFRVLLALDIGLPFRPIPKLLRLRAFPGLSELFHGQGARSKWARATHVLNYLGYRFDSHGDVKLLEQWIRICVQSGADPFFARRGESSFVDCLNLGEPGARFLLEDIRAIHSDNSVVIK